MQLDNAPKRRKPKPPARGRKDAGPSIPPGARIEFRTTDGSVAAVKALRGEASPVLSEGVGGWSVVDRPKRISATVWRGRSLFRMNVSILFDGFDARSSQEDEINRLIRMGLSPEAHSEPPKIKVSGGTPGDQYTWVIDSITWGDNVIWDFDERGSLVRFRQDAVVSLLQYEQISLVRTKATGSGGTNRNRYYTVKQGDTLKSIAVKFYKDASQWRKIAKANNLRGPKSIKVGQRLRIP